MTFDMAFGKLRAGQCIARLGWVHDGVYLYFVPGSRFKADRPPLSNFYPAGAEISYQSHIDQRTVSGAHAPWDPRVEDLLADDWVITRS